MPSSVFSWERRVTYADCTLGNHVYYGRYLSFLEEARGELFRAAGIPCKQLQEQDTIFPVVECRLRYKAPACYDDVLRIKAWIVAAEGVRLTIGYRIANDNGALVLQGEIVHACTDTGGKLKRVPSGICEALRPYTAEGTC